MDTESRLNEIERKLKLLDDHEHTGVDSKRIQNANIDGSSSSIVGQLVMGSTQVVSDSNQVLINYDTLTKAVGITTSTTDKSFTIITAGHYEVTAQYGIQPGVDAKNYYISIFKGASVVTCGGDSSSSSTGRSIFPKVTATLYDLVAGDVITIKAYQTSGDTVTLSNDFGAGLGNPSFFNIKKI